MQCGCTHTASKKQNKKHLAYRCKERYATETAFVVSTGFEISTVQIKYG